jgi:hypothetical protein
MPTLAPVCSSGQRQVSRALDRVEGVESSRHWHGEAEEAAKRGDDVVHSVANLDGFVQEEVLEHIRQDGSVALQQRSHEDARFP